jgi:[acyl-carrier-protein] S-malonyltransferase
MQKAAGGDLASGMLAVRASAVDVAEALSDIPTVAIANDNGPQQVVIAGDLATLARAAERLRGRRLRSSRLAVTAAFHHPLMEPVVSEMAAALEGVEFRAPQFTVISGLTAQPFEDIPHELLAAITAPVRWREVMRWLLDAGVTRFVDLGPGRVLAGLASKSVQGYRNVEIV